MINAENVFNELITKADVAFNQKEFISSRSFYQQSLEIKPGFKRASDRLLEIEELLNQALLKTRYDSLIVIADNYFNQVAYDNALQKYNEALSLMPREEYPKNRINEINAINNEAAEAARLAAIEAEKDSLYNAAIARADNLFDATDYENSRNEYRNALNVKPTEQYPQNRITEIGNILAQLSAAQKAYEDAISRADRNFRSEAFDPAKLAYNEAKAAKPDETYPDEMIAKIDSIVETRARIAAEQAAAEAARLAAIEAEKDSLYNAAIARADNLFDATDYENSRNEYRNALNVKPTEQYPQNRITEINRILSEIAEAKKQQEIIDKNYLDAIRIADNYFRERSYQVSKENYQKAGSIKPEEEYPVNKIAEIDKILAQQKIDEQYREIILAADGFFRSKSYSDAKIQYNEALNLKANESYPSNQIKIIDGILADQERQIVADQQAAQDLERRREAANVINQQLEQQDIVNETELTDLYKAYLVNADSYFDSKNYNLSRGWYYKAWDVKPEETYPPQRIAEINRIVGSMLSSQLDKDYQNFVNLADSMMRENQLAVARGWYNRALSVKPNEQYPKNQLDEIQKLIQERLAGQSGELFKNHVLKAQNAFESEKFNVARFWYKKALELQPNNQEIKSKLEEIQKAIQ